MHSTSTNGSGGGSSTDAETVELRRDPMAVPHALPGSAMRAAGGLSALRSSSRRPGTERRPGES